MVSRRTTEQRCPLCTARYDDRTALRIHLAVDHRKSAVISHLLDEDVASSETEAKTGETRPPNTATDESVTRDRPSRALQGQRKTTETREPPEPQNGRESRDPSEPRTPST